MQYSYQRPGPQGTLRLAQPELSWPLVPRSGARVVDAELWLDGTPIPTRYDDTTGTVRATPSAPLAPGTYQVRCRVTLSPRQAPAETSWSFSIASDALATLPAPSTWARAAHQAANKLRASLGLPALILDPRLCAAAQAHARYLDTNKLVSHSESPDKPGFVGAAPWERAQAFGYLGTLAEDVSYAEGTPEKIVRGLFDAPYHRLPFLKAGSLLFGAGNAGKASGLLFGGDGTPGTALSPYDGETEVAPIWRNSETPSPTRSLPDAPKLLGYPIVLVQTRDDDRPLVVKSARLTTDTGTELRCLLNTPRQDSELTDACLLIPLTPLQPSTRYRVEVVTSEHTHRWSFTTRAEAPTDFGPLDLRPSEQKLIGTLEKADRKNDLLVLRVTRAQTYDRGEQEFRPPLTVTLKLSARTRFLSESNRGGTIAFTPGLPLAAIVPGSSLQKPLPIRTLILLR